MKRIEWIMWSGLLLAGATLSVSALRPVPPPADVDADEPLWWRPKPAVRAASKLNRFEWDVVTDMSHLHPMAFIPDYAAEGIGFDHFRLSAQTPSTPWAPPPRPMQTDTSDRFWKPDEDAFDILGPRGQGREPGWLERSVMAREDEDMRSREREMPTDLMGTDLMGTEGFFRQGLIPSDRERGILGRESIFSD